MISEELDFDLTDGMPGSDVRGVIGRRRDFANVRRDYMALINGTRRNRAVPRCSGEFGMLPLGEVIPIGSHVVQEESG